MCGVSFRDLNIEIQVDCIDAAIYDSEIRDAWMRIIELQDEISDQRGAYWFGGDVDSLLVHVKV
jgi:hypothetical protein